MLPPISLVQFSKNSLEQSKRAAFECSFKACSFFLKECPIGLKRARLNAYRPQCNHTGSLVWALGEHKRPTGQIFIPSGSARADQAVLPLFF